MGRFFDAATGGPLRLELHSLDGTRFALLRRIAYASDHHAQPFVVPADLATFRTDLTSVPRVFTWLVPRTGAYLPAAVLHDGLVSGQYEGPAVDRFAADRIFRAAAVALDNRSVRAWLMWAAATTGSMWACGRAARRLALVLLLGAVTALGLAATLDLADVWDVLPWMGVAPLWRELLGGAVAAVVVPTLLALTWGREAPAGIVVGVALALLLHVTIAVAALYLLYLGLERVVSGPPRAAPRVHATITVR